MSEEKVGLYVSSAYLYPGKALVKKLAQMVGIDPQSCENVREITITAEIGHPNIQVDIEMVGGQEIVKRINAMLGGDNG